MFPRKEVVVFNGNVMLGDDRCRLCLHTNTCSTEGFEKVVLCNKKLLETGIIL